MNRSDSYSVALANAIPTVPKLEVSVINLIFSSVFRTAHWWI